MPIFKILFLVLVTLLNIFKFTESLNSDYSKDNLSYTGQEIVEIKIISKENKEVVASEKENGINLEEIDVIIFSKTSTLVLNLHLNKNIISNGHFYAYQKNGEIEIDERNVEKNYLCDYQGKIRGNAESWVTLSTCEDLSGIIFDEFSSSFIYNLKNDAVVDFTSIKKRRRKRSASTVLGTNYLELILVLDNSVYRKLDSSQYKSIAYASAVANMLYMFYYNVEIYIVLVGVVVWTERDEIVYERNQILNNFHRYCENKLRPLKGYDSAQLIGSLDFNSTVGVAYTNEVCTSRSVGVNTDQTQMLNLALTMAHEIGHNLGLDHDDELPDNCYCPEIQCIMISVRSRVTSSFSNCSIQRLKEKNALGDFYCLKNKPRFIFTNSSICGNKLVEPGEECDCGNELECQNPCCNATSCTLLANASCATGDCCDLKTCKLKPPATTCRPSKNDCDLPEYCSGKTQFCPADTFKLETETCFNGKSYCHRGFCLTDNVTKIKRYGGIEYNSNEECYAVDSSLVNYDNICHSNVFQKLQWQWNKTRSSSFVTCSDANYEKLEFDSKLYVLFSRIFFDSSIVIACNLVMISNNFNIEPVIEACSTANCTSMAQIRNQIPVCSQDCHNRGWCNNKGECHCFDDFEPPDCYNPGTGGSWSSGYARDPNAYRVIENTIYIFFLGVVPFAALVTGLVYYYLMPALKSFDRRSVQIRRPMETFVRAVSQRFSSTPSNDVRQPRTVNQSQIANRHNYRPNEAIYSEVQTKPVISSNVNGNSSGPAKSEFNSYTNVNIHLYNKCAENSYANTNQLPCVSQYTNSGKKPTSCESIYENLEKNFGHVVTNINSNKDRHETEQLSRENIYSNVHQLESESVKPQEERIYENLQNSFGKDAVKKKTKPAILKKPFVQKKGSTETLVKHFSSSRQTSGEDNVCFEQPSVKDIIKQLNSKK